MVYLYIRPLESTQTSLYGMSFLSSHSQLSHYNTELLIMTTVTTPDIITLYGQLIVPVHNNHVLLEIISWVIFNHARPTYESIRNIKSNHALESSHGETAMTG